MNSRNAEAGAFRDLQVCTDGIQFDLVHYEQPEVVGDPDPGLGAVPAGPSSEAVHITTDLAQTANPLGDLLAPDLTPGPGTVLVGDFSITPRSNTHPQTVNFFPATIAEVYLFWYDQFTLEWSTQLTPGTQLAVYLQDGLDGTQREIITVIDCTLFDDPTPGDPCDHPNAIIGTPGNDKIIGTNGDDIICALGGNDKIFSYGGDDVIYAGDGNDKVHAGSGDDTVFGEGGNDKLLGQWGNDTLDGGAGNDKVHGSSGDDVLIGGPGHDNLLGGNGHDTLTQ